MKKGIFIGVIAYTLAVSVSIFSCQKKNNVNPNVQKIEAHTGQNAGIQIPNIGSYISIAHGTRKQAKANEHHDEVWGTNFSDGTSCQGRSICFGGNLVKGPDGNTTDEVIVGGMMPYAGQTIIPNTSVWSVHQDNYNNFYFEIKPEHILSATSDIVFENDVYIQDVDYYLPSFITDAFGVNSIVLKAGTHPITRNNGVIKFYANL